MCHVVNALDPALVSSKVQDDLYLFPEATCTYLASDSFWTNYSLDYASQLCMPIDFTQPHTIYEHQLNYNGCEPWFSGWIDEDFGTQEPQTCNLPNPVVASNVLHPVDLSRHTVVPVESSPMSLSSIDSSSVNQLRSWVDEEEYDCAMRTSGKSHARSDFFLHNGISHSYTISHLQNRCSRLTFATQYCLLNWNLLRISRPSPLR